VLRKVRKKKRFFVVSDSSLEYKEIRRFEAKAIVSVLVVGIVLVILVLSGNSLLGDPLRLGYDILPQVISENQVLKQQIKNLTTEVRGTQQRLESLADRSNELRLMVDLPKIDADTREAAIGGSVAESRFGFLGGEAAELLTASQMLIEKLDREIKLQQASYAEVMKRYEFNKEFFAHLPAIKPVEGYYSVNGFGMRVHPVLRVWRMHEGIDIITDVGANVYATGDGNVRYAGRTQGGYGAVIEISHGYGYSSLYAHLSKTLVKPGQRVKRGELIAKTGRSGLVSGPHLHYEVRYKGRKQNPVDYFFDDVNAARYRAQLATTQKEG